MDIREIARTLEQMAVVFPETSPDDAPRFEHRAGGSYVLRFKPNRRALMSVVKKLSEGSRTYSLPKQRLPSLKRRYDKDVFKRFLADDEIDNAINYALAFDEPILFSRGEVGRPDRPLVHAERIAGREDFVVGRIYFAGKLRGWRVYHAEHGVACTSEFLKKTAAVSRFNSAPLEAINRAVKAEAQREHKP